MKRGIYRNQLGVELIVEQVTPSINRIQVIGPVYLARQEDSVLGTRYLYVTEQGLRECRYELIEEHS